MWKIVILKTKRKPKPEPNYELRAWGTTALGDIRLSTKKIYAKTRSKAEWKAQSFAIDKENEIAMDFPNFSMYEDKSYPNSIGVKFDLKKIR